jgi:outer membrane receptor for ferrienterochelin and colicins
MKLYLFFFLLITSVAAYSQDGSISGYITESDSIPVAGATVMLKGTTIGTITDKNGQYSLTRIKAGTYDVRVSLVGYETIEKTVVAGSGNTALDFDITISSINLNEVVVTGTRSEKALKDVPVITQVISGKQMMDLGITNAVTALQKMVPGLEVSQYGTRASITLQGLSAKYVLFLIDGERIAGEINGDIDYSMLNLENIDRIEVIKGASSSLYGSNAIGGVINIITKKITDPFDAKLYSRYSKFNELNAGGGIGLKKGIVGSRTSVNYSRTDGYDNTPETSHDWTQNPYSTYSINQKFEITPNSKISIVPYLTYYKFERGNVSARPAHDLYTDLSGGMKGDYFSGKHSINVSYYRDRYNTYNILELLDNKKDTVSWDLIQTARAQGNFQLSDNNILISGLEYNNEKLYSDRVAGGTKSAGEAVIYAQEDIKISGKWNIVAGIRASLHSTYGFKAAPKISLMYKYSFMNFRASAGTGFRSPSLKELYMYFDHFGEWYIIGNPDLIPETSKYISGSAEFLKPWNNSSVSFYRNELKNMITDRWLTDSLQLTRQYENIASASVYGIDLIIKQKITRGLWMSAGYSYVHSRDNETGLQLYGTAKHSGNFSLDYNLRKKNHSFTVQLYCKVVGEKFYEVTSEGESVDKPYNSWRLTLSEEYKWIRFSAGIDNIFDLVLPYNYDFISPGRRLFIGMNIDFGKIK